MAYGDLIPTSVTQHTAPIPVRSEYVATGSTAVITRMYYQDGTTRIAKNALNPSFNKPLVHEYTFLTLLQRRTDSAIPRVYNEFPPNGSSNRYGFVMEDMKGYSALISEETREDITRKLDTADKLFLLHGVAQALYFANVNNNILHGDVQLQQIMTNGRKIKLVDWGNAQWVDLKNNMIDVYQFAKIIEPLFIDAFLVPPSIKEWAVKVQNKGFSSCKEAWLNFMEKWGESFENETRQIELLRKKIYGPSMNASLFSKQTQEI